MNNPKRNTMEQNEPSSEERNDHVAVAVVTGAGSGIGLGVSARLARDGARVFGLERDSARQDDFLAACAQSKAPAAFMQLDVSDPDAVAGVFAEIVEEVGRIDILVNNAGIRDIGSVLDLKPSDWKRVLDVDLGGSLYCAQAAGRTMVQQGSGRIVNIASIAGLVAFANRPAYTVAKHGVIGLTRVLAAELGSRGVTVNAVCPGLTRTALTESYVSEPNVVESLKIVVPIGRPSEVDEMADAVAFLASDAARYINGVALPVDGGFMATGTFDVTGQSPTFVKPFSPTEAGL